MDADAVLLDAGVLIAALTSSDARHPEALPLIEQARTGAFPAFTTTSILCEVYAALTWSGAEPPHPPRDAAQALLRLLERPSALAVLGDGPEVAALTLQLAAAHQLTARRVHDARHAATALAHGIAKVYTYDVSDWASFIDDGIHIAGPPSVRPSHAKP